MNKNSSAEYVPLFELGLLGDFPAVKILDNFEMDPVNLAALMTALFETVMITVSEQHQIEYEKKFNKALKVLMKERHKYDITVEYRKDEEDE